MSDKIESKEELLQVKQVIVIRRDLKMRRGKEVAQGAHASMAFLLAGLNADDRQLEFEMSDAEKQWLLSGHRKICVRVQSEAELLDIHQKAIDSGLKSHLIRDSGKTEFSGQPTYTCCAIGPDMAAEIDLITAHLELM